MNSLQMRWFFIDDAGNLRGPADIKTLSVLVETGIITPSTQMRREDTDEWAAAETFFDFAPDEPPPPPEPSTPPPQQVPVVIDMTSRSSVRASKGSSTSSHGGSTLAEHKGELGEDIMLSVLQRSLPLGGERGYRIIRNLMLETPTGTTQLDFTIVSAYGIFIIEVKNYKGWIFGDPFEPRWTQVLSGGRKFQLQNPIRQNFKHLAVLSEKTGIPEKLIFPVIAFSPQSEFKTDMPANVLHFADVADYIQKFKSVIIKPEQLAEITETFVAWDNDIGEEKKRDHVQNLKEAHAPASIHDRNVLCPRCGNRMVLRKSKQDGHPFWGCAKFPACRGMREAVE